MLALARFARAVAELAAECAREVGSELEAVAVGDLLHLPVVRGKQFRMGRMQSRAQDETRDSADMLERPVQVRTGDPQFVRDPLGREIEFAEVVLDIEGGTLEQHRLDRPPRLLQPIGRRLDAGRDHLRGGAARLPKLVKAHVDDTHVEMAQVIGEQCVQVAPKHGVAETVEPLRHRRERRARQPQQQAFTIGDTRRIILIERQQEHGAGPSMHLPLAGFDPRFARPEVKQPPVIDATCGIGHTPETLSRVKSRTEGDVRHIAGHELDLEAIVRGRAFRETDVAPCADARLPDIELLRRIVERRREHPRQLRGSVLDVPRPTRQRNAFQQPRVAPKPMTFLIHVFSRQTAFSQARRAALPMQARCPQTCRRSSPASTANDDGYGIACKPDAAFLRRLHSINAKTILLLFMIALVCPALLPTRLGNLTTNTQTNNPFTEKSRILSQRKSKAGVWPTQMMKKIRKIFWFLVIRMQRMLAGDMQDIQTGCRTSQCEARQ